MQKAQPLALTLIQLRGVQSRFLSDVLLVLGGSLAMALLAQVSIPLPFTPVPITGQSLGVLLLGASLGSKRGFLAVLAYLVEGCVGLPVFAGGAFGLARLLGPSGGYLVGLLLAAYVCGLIAERGGERNLRTAVPAFVAAQFTIFLVGIPWLGFTTGFEHIWMKGLIPFLPGLILKSTAAGFMLPAAWKFVDDAQSR